MLCILTCTLSCQVAKLFERPSYIPDSLVNSQDVFLKLLLFHNYLQQTIETANTYLEQVRRGVTEIPHCTVTIVARSTCSHTRHTNWQRDWRLAITRSLIRSRDVCYVQVSGVRTSRLADRDPQIFGLSADPMTGTVCGRGPSADRPRIKTIIATLAATSHQSKHCIM